MSTETSSIRDGELNRSSAEKPGLSIVIPCFNETLSIGPLAESLVEMEVQLGDRYRIELLVVDDGSTDDTWQTLGETFHARPNVRLLRHRRNRGVAAAIATGIRAARYEIVASIDSDCTYDPCQLANLLPLLTDGVDLVTASPYHPEGDVRNVPRWRLALSLMASWLYRRLLRNKLHCYTSCFRIYRRNAVESIDLQNPGFVGIAELLWHLDRRGATILECPAVLNARRLGQSKMNTFHATLGHLRLLGGIFGYRLGRSAGGHLPWTTTSTRAPDSAKDEPARQPEIENEVLR